MLWLAASSAAVVDAVDLSVIVLRPVYTCVRTFKTHGSPTHCLGVL